MTEDVRLKQWLTVYLLPQFGPAAFDQVLQATHGKLEQLFAWDVGDLLRAGLTDLQISSLKNPDQSKLDVCLNWLYSSKQNFLLTIQDPGYPSQLREISRPPPVLFGIGNQAILEQPQLAIVGSRNPSVGGKEIAKSMARALSEQGWVVTSGLAVGIDGCAHQGAIDAAKPTVAVLGTGIDKVYPHRHQRLAKQIIEFEGCLLSEFIPATPAAPHNFPRRNRIISGLSKGTLVVEAAIKSGSLITTRFALEQGREVFAVPGNIHSPQSKGCHFIIKNGAKLVEGVDDINEEFQNLSFINAYAPEKNTQKTGEQGLATDKLLDSVDYEATAIDVVVQRSGLSLEVVTATLLEYELRGLVTTISGGYIKLRG
ncbi:DNA-processing protein DprA [Neptunicella sp. SCSIO 80796]|uniref:DNA-processing protein DprA n=1 Tax=Neptunicella plasticusilytica TaxID=3117012 RepID=UPI003A4E2819